MVVQLNAFAAEVTRVAREVGTEGRLGGQARVEGVSGVWRDLTENVNTLADNLSNQVRNIADVTTAVANGDLTRKITVDARGEILELKNTINTMVDQLSSFADEVTRVAREVGTEGQLGGQANVKDVSGTWKDLTDSVNFMANNLTTQVRNIADVTTAVASGDLTRKITVDARGEVAALAETINTMVDQLSSFADEVTRVAREVGTEGILGGQANVKGVEGTWKDLTDSVNGLSSSLTTQVRNIADVTTAVANGDLSKKITVDVRGEVLELKETINAMVDQLRAFSSEVTRVAREVGSEGILGGQARVEGVSGVWADLTDNVNFMASNLTTQVRNIADVTTAVANGDLTRKITVEASGEVAALADTINTMVDQLSSFADEVTRVAREVGTEGILGGQANVKGVSGTWKDLTDNVNTLADNLSNQVRNIADVTTAVAQGDLSKKITVDVRGEILQLKNTVNTMVDQLASFAAEVTRVAREVGTEGILGGQANVEGVSGVWQGLTDNVNTLAGALTTQLRAIAEVTTAVTNGDLTREIAVEARGEVEELRDNINQMITNLRETTEVNAQQDWLNTNMARFGGMLQGQRDLKAVSRLVMSELTPLVGGQHGAFFMAESEGDGEPQLRLIASYAYKRRKGVPNVFGLGEGLVGQAALERKSILVTKAPEDYIAIALRPRRGRPGQHHRPPRPLRGPGDGGDRDGVVRAVLGGAPDVPRAAVGDARRRREHDRRDDADGGAPAAVAGPDDGAAEPVGGAAVAARRARADEPGARRAGAVAEGVRGAAPAAAGGAAADERGARGEGGTARRAERAHRAEERRGRGGTDRARGQGRAARALLEVQERVPREHEPRAAHAAQLAADPRQAPLGQPGGHAHRQAGRVREDDLQRRLRSARADQRHPRPLEGRGREDGREPAAGDAGGARGLRRAELPPGRRPEAARVRRDRRRRAARRRSSPTSSGCSR